MLKYLRIAVTAVGLMACMLLMALWMRSYWHHTTKEFLVTRDHRYYIHSTDGRVIANREPRIIINIELFRGGEWGFRRMTTYVGLGYVRQSNGSLYAVSIPYWLIVILSCASATLPWIRWRFCLRTLLIATALVAAGLGMVIYLSG